MMIIGIIITITVAINIPLIINDDTIFLLTMGFTMISII
jgi:hypothetical protein